MQGRERSSDKMKKERPNVDWDDKIIVDLQEH
jgi:hypothetical protein